jgi:hypothetical protein
VRNVTFSEWQPIYAEHGIAIVPVSPEKIPLVKYPQKFGLPASAKIAAKFSDAKTFGYYTGPHSNITVLDIDIADENVLATALDRHGPSPIIVRTGSGKFHALYRHNGERRSIRPWGKEVVPIDLLGATGLCIAPPSIGAKGHSMKLSKAVSTTSIACRSCGISKTGSIWVARPSSATKTRRWRLAAPGHGATGQPCARAMGGIMSSGVNS